MISDALSARTLSGRVKQPLKKEHSTDEALLAQMVETWRLQQWVFSPNLLASVKVICSSPEICDNLGPGPFRKAKSRLVVARCAKSIAIVYWRAAPCRPLAAVAIVDYPKYLVSKLCIRLTSMSRNAAGGAKPAERSGMIGLVVAIGND
jgi:hypothetical protein